MTTLILFPCWKVCKQTFLTALPKGISFGHELVATDYQTFVHSIPKNGKLPSVKQSHFLNGVSFSSFSTADATKVEQVVTHLINLKALRFHPYLYILIYITLCVVEICLSRLYEEMKTLTKLKPCFRCICVLVQLMEPEAFCKSEYHRHLVVAVIAFALSFFPQGFFSMRVEKKSWKTIAYK